MMEEENRKNGRRGPSILREGNTVVELMNSQWERMNYGGGGGMVGEEE